MSTLSQFAPFAGGGLKSFQTGWLYTTANTQSPAAQEDNSYLDISVSSVNTAKTVTSFEGSTSGGYNYQSAQLYDKEGPSGIITTRMTSATNLRLASMVWNSPIYGGRWKIAEAN